MATTIYPAIVRVRDRLELQQELFTSASRIGRCSRSRSGPGLALFAGDLVDFVLGEEWEPAVPLIAGLALITAAGQIGYTWFAFQRARGEPGPQAVETGVLAGTFLALAVPGALAWGTTGFLAGRAAGMACVLAVRRAYLRRLLPAIRVEALALRAAIPAAVASAAVLAVRPALWGGDRPLGQALGELALWALVRGRARAAARRRAAARAARARARARGGAGGVSAPAVAPARAPARAPSSRPRCSSSRRC